MNTPIDTHMNMSIYYGYIFLIFDCTYYTNIIYVLDSKLEKLKTKCRYLFSPSEIHYID